MRIKRIEIIGFKSFCDRTVLDISTPITAVVGPNGCGKSNIVDAIRWCMGEQSAKHLRGKAMDDVIFAGSEGRGPSGMAEVSLTFEQVGFSHETMVAAQAEVPEIGDVPEICDVPDVAEAPEGAETAEAPGTPGTPETEAVPVEVAAAEEPEPDLGAPIPIDFSQYNEVTITRRLFRDGGSGYFINKTPCRLLDVTDFFLGTGVGTKAYSIIEQGRIGMIVSARPGDRRLIIEEAAGITKFKVKKKAAERRLDHTRQNLLRLSDIVGELEKQLGTLRRQAQKAERYRKYRAESKDIELHLASHRLLGALAQEKVAAAALAEAAEGRDRTRAEQEVGEAAVTAERAELSIEERRLSGLQEQIWELDNRIKLGESRIEFARREVDDLEQRVAGARAEIAAIAAERERAAVEREELGAERTQLIDELEASSREVAQCEAGHADARTMLSWAQRALDSARAELSAARADMARSESGGKMLARRRDDAAARLARVVEERDVAAPQAREREREAHRLDEKLSTLRQTRLDIGARAETLEERKGELEERAQAAEVEVETLRTELHRRRSRLQSLVEIHDRYEGFARGTRAVMQRTSELGDGARRIRGLVADHVDAPAGLEIAVEAALGDRLGGVLVDAAEVGVQAIRYLKDASAGRAAFVPLGGGDLGGGGSGGIEVTDLSGCGIGGEPVLLPMPIPMPMMDGVVGSMLDLVRVDGGMDVVARRLLGEHVIVDTLDRAIALHRSGIDRTLVTLEGDVVDRRGVVSGGSRESTGAGVLAQKREIRELEEITAGLETDLTDATARLVTTRTELGQVTRALNGLRADSHDGELAILTHDKDLSRCRGELERLRERLTRLGTEQLELEQTLEAIDREQAETAALAKSAFERADQHERAQLGLIDGVMAGQASLDEAGRALTAVKVRAAHAAEKRASLDAALARLETRDSELARRAAKLEQSIEVDGARGEALRDETARLTGELGPERARRGELAFELGGGRTEYERRQGALAETELRTRELRQAADRLAGEASAREIELHDLAAAVAHLEEGVFERYQLQLRRIVGDYHLRPAAGDPEQQRLAELRQLIERMGGDINLTAIEECEEVSKRHEFLSGQKIDLERAVEQLERAIAKINKTSRKLFRDTFDAVNARFQEVFPRLFHGGVARLALSGGDDADLLEAGVEIVAQPPGKKNTTVEQLSGGEKALTAVALIVAIFLIKPSPFCLLDEVDAPLDDANVDRYNELVRQMTDRSQFIVISHNKRTMQIADRLYGVTMQEPGVSKLVSVNLRALDGRAAA